MAEPDTRHRCSCADGANHLRVQQAGDHGRVRHLGRQDLRLAASRNPARPVQGRARRLGRALARTHARRRSRPLPGLARRGDRSDTERRALALSGSGDLVFDWDVSADKIFVAPPAAAPLYRALGRDATARDLAPFGLQYGGFFLTVGTLEPRKNIRTLIAAYSRLSAAERQLCPLVVAGGKGWGDLNLPAQAEALRSDGTLRFLVSVSNPQLRSLYEGARLMLMPSLYEGFGMPVVEALACGSAVAHSASTSMDEISGNLGRRVTAEDVDGWTATLREVEPGGEHVDVELRNTRIERARQFNWHRSAELVNSAYRQLILG